MIKGIGKKNILKIFIGLAVVSFLVMASPVGQNFFVQLAQEKILHRLLRSPDVWKERVQHCAFIGIFFLAAIYFLSFINLGKQIFSNIKTEITPFAGFLKSKRGTIMLLSVFVWLTFVFYKIIAADVQFADDIGRSFFGLRSWIDQSRYISEFFSPILHTTVRLTDIAPLPQIIAILVMAFSVMLATWLCSEGNVSVLGLAAMSLMCLSPFFSETISYRFDSPYMALSIFFPITPFVFKKNCKTFLFVSVIAVILSCMSYQAGASAYIMFAIFFALMMWLKNNSAKEIVVFVFSAVVAFLFAMLLYRFLFTNVQRGEFGGGVSDSYLSVSLKSIPSNLSNYICFVSYFFGGVWIKFFACLCFLCAYIMTVRNSKRNKIVSAVVVFAVFVGAFALSLGVYLVFGSSFILARSVMGFNVYIALISFLCVKKWDEKSTFGNLKYGKFKLFRKFCVAALIYGCVVFMFSYGNALAKQKTYREFRTSILLGDLQKFSLENEKIKIGFSGSIGLVETLKVAVKKYPMFEGLLLGAFPLTGEIFWYDCWFCYYNLNYEVSQSLSPDDLPLLCDTYYHAIYGDGKNFFIDLKCPAVNVQ